MIDTYAMISNQIAATETSDYALTILNTEETTSPTVLGLPFHRICD